MWPSAHPAARPGARNRTRWKLSSLAQVVTSGTHRPWRTRPCATCRVTLPPASDCSILCPLAPGRAGRRARSHRIAVRSRRCHRRRNLPRIPIRHRRSASRRHRFQCLRHPVRHRCRSRRSSSGWVSVRRRTSGASSGIQPGGVVQDRRCTSSLHWSELAADANAPWRSPARLYSCPVLRPRFCQPFSMTSDPAAARLRLMSMC